MTDTPSLVGELAYLTGITEAARRRLKEGQLLDLSSLDERCAALCTKLETVTGPDRDKLQKAFLALVGELNLLEAELGASRDLTMNEISAVAHYTTDDDESCLRKLRDLVAVIPSNARNPHVQIPPRDARRRSGPRAPSDRRPRRRSRGGEAVAVRRRRSSAGGCGCRARRGM